MTYDRPDADLPVANQGELPLRGTDNLNHHLARSTLIGSSGEYLMEHARGPTVPCERNPREALEVVPHQTQLKHSHAQFRPDQRC